MPFAEAVALLRAGDALAARSLLLVAPEGAERDFLLGACAHALGEVPEALRAFSAALQRNPAHAQAACALGSLWAGLGRPAEAEALFRQTLTHNDDPQLHFNLGVLREQQGDVVAARAAYAAALARDPGHYGARHNRAGLAAAQRQWQEAADDYRELIRRHPEVTLPWHNLAELELAQGRYAEAQRLLQEVLAREPDNGKAWLSQAVAQAAAGQLAESAASFARLGEV
ncbi:MAG: tetratricopeptide repeat protein, partial [Moraxellaceae bacterium]